MSMKPINIRDQNEEKITAAFSDVNGTANAHTFTGGWEALIAARCASAYIGDLGLSKARMIGAKAIVVSGGDVPNAYRWKRRVNRIQLERRKAGWFLNSIDLIEIWGSAPKPVYQLTRQQDEMVVAKLRSAYELQELFEEQLDGKLARDADTLQQLAVELQELFEGDTVGN